MGRLRAFLHSPEEYEIATPDTMPKDVVGNVTPGARRHGSKAALRKAKGKPDGRDAAVSDFPRGRARRASCPSRRHSNGS